MMIDGLAKLLVFCNPPPRPRYKHLFSTISGIVEEPGSSEHRAPRECQLHKSRNEAANIVHRSHTAHQLNNRSRLRSKQGLNLNQVVRRSDGESDSCQNALSYFNNQQTHGGCMNEFPHRNHDVLKQNVPVPQ